MQKEIDVNFKEEKQDGSWKEKPNILLETFKIKFEITNRWRLKSQKGK
jgi:hypothetical protein